MVLSFFERKLLRTKSPIWEVWFDNRTLPHELLHATGIYHEQSRPDRDKFVEIHENCISNGEEHNFYKHSTSHTYGLEYNPKSIMHYRKTAFSRKSGCRTITSKARTVEYENSNISCDWYCLFRYLVWQMTFLVLLKPWQNWTMKKL